MLEWLLPVPPPLTQPAVIAQTVAAAAAMRHDCSESFLHTVHRFCGMESKFAAKAVYLDNRQTGLPGVRVLSCLIIMQPIIN